MDETPTARWPWIAIVLVYLALRLPALLAYAPTYDEPIYVGAGKELVTHHDLRAAALLYHPPLAYHLTSLPLWFLDTPSPDWDPKGFGSQVGLAVLYDSKTRGGAALSPQTMIVLSRLPVLAFGLIGLWLAFALGRRLAGPRCGLLAAAAWAAWPDMAAQSVQATTDLVAAVAALLLARAALRHFDAVGTRPEFARTTHVLLGAACGVAALAKHTLLVPIAIVALWSVVLRVQRSRRGIEQPKRPALRFAAACLTALAVLWAGYVFELGPLASSSGGHEHSAAIARMTGLAPETVDRLASSVPVPAPTYWRSVADAFLEKARARDAGIWGAYLNGTWQPEGFLGYFPLAVLVKTPIALLVVMLAAIPGWWLTRRSAGYAADLLLVLAVVPFAAAMASRLNIGVRHVLPATQFLLVLGAAAMALSWERRPAVARVAVGVLAALLAAEWAVDGADPLPFANVPSGGPAALHRRLADSNLEMGQDLWRLERWCEENSVGSIVALLHDPQGLYAREVTAHRYLLPRDAIEAAPRAEAARLVDAARGAPQEGPVPPSGLFAIGESVLVRPAYAALEPVEPLARVGRTRVYRLAR